MNDAMLQTILLVANGDLRQSANEKTWPGQEAMEKQLTAAVARLGYKLVRADASPAAVQGGALAANTAVATSAVPRRAASRPCMPAARACAGAAATRSWPCNGTRRCSCETRRLSGLHRCW